MPDKAAPKKPAVTRDLLEQQLADLTAALQRERADATNLRRRHGRRNGGLA